MDVMDKAGHDNLATCNMAVLNGVNEQLTAAKHRVRHYGAHHVNLVFCLCSCMSEYVSVCLSVVCSLRASREFVIVLSLT